MNIVKKNKNKINFKSFSCRDLILWIKSNLIWVKANTTFYSILLFFVLDEKNIIENNGFEKEKDRIENIIENNGLEKDQIANIVQEPSIFNQFIEQYSEPIIIVCCVALAIVYCYYQGYFSSYSGPYIFTEEVSIDLTGFKLEIVKLLKKPVIEWTYSDTLLIWFHHPQIYNNLDFSKLDPYVCCKFLSFFKSINYKDIGFNVPENYIAYVLDTSGKIIPKEFEPYYAECINNIIINSNLCDPKILSEVKSILPQVLSNPNADPTLVAKLLTDDAFLITRKVLLEDFNIHPSLIKLYIPEEILNAAYNIVQSGVTS